jgi:hypothetical protein
MTTWNFNRLTTSAHAGSLAAYVFNSQGTQHIMYIDNNDLHVHELWSSGGGTWSLHDLTEASGAPESNNPNILTAYVFDLGEIRSLGGGLPPVIIPSANSTQHVDYIDANNDVHELYWTTSGLLPSSSSGWHNNDLSKAANVSLPGPVTFGYQAGLAGYVFYSQRTQHVICNGADGHIHELWWGSDGWHPNDLTVQAAAPKPNNPGSVPVGCAFESQGTQHVFYIGSDNDVHELLWDTNGWRHNDLTAKSGATAGNAISSPAAYVFSAKETLNVFYIDNNSDVHQLSSDGDGNWTDIDLTAAAGASAGASRGLVGYEFADGTQHVDYFGQDGDVHELSWDGNWSDTDLTAAANVSANTPAPNPFIDLVGYAFNAQGTRQVIYTAEDGNIYELSSS